MDQHDITCSCTAAAANLLDAKAALLGNVKQKTPDFEKAVQGADTAICDGEHSHTCKDQDCIITDW